MNQPTKPTEDKPGKPNASDKQHGIGVVELLFAVTTLGTAVLFAALGGPKLPPMNGD